MGRARRLKEERRQRTAQKIRQAPQETGTTRRSFLKLLGIGIGVCTLGGLGYLVSSSKDEGSYSSIQDLEASLKEVSAYTGQGLITMDQARAYPELRPQFVEQAKRLLPQNHDIEDLLYVANETEYVDAMMQAFDMAIIRGKIKPIESEKRDYKDDVTSMAKEALTKGATNTPFSIWAGNQCPELVVITPSFFSDVVVKYASEEWIPFSSVKDIDQSKKIERIYWSATTEEDVRSTLLHELVHVRQQKDGITIAGKKFIGRQALEINHAYRAGVSWIMETQAYNQQIRDILDGKVNPSQPYREHIEHTAKFIAEEGLVLITRLTQSQNPHEQTLGYMAQTLLQERQELKDF